MTIGERIRSVRKGKKLTQQAFAEKIGIRRATVGCYEINQICPSDRTISDICREFEVSETWLRTGEGEMFVQAKTFDLDEYARDQGATEFELGMVRLYFSLPPDVRAQMMDALKEYVAEYAGEDPQPMPVTEGDSSAEQDPSARLAELERQNRDLQTRLEALEKEAALEDEMWENSGAS